MPKHGLPLNSYDEWSPLKELILGSAEHYFEHYRDLSFDMFFSDNLTGTRGYYPRLGAGKGDSARHVINKRYVEELVEDVEGMADAFRDSSITVHRPLQLDPALSAVTTPAWSAPVLPPLNLRDNTLILGDEVIETPPMLRARYFETQFLKPAFAEYFQRGARWTVMPRPIMTDQSFDPSYVSASSGGNTESPASPANSPYDVGFEMMIDGAQCLRLGRDLVVNVSTKNHELGCDWLERHTAGKFKVHRMYRLTDSHIDSAVLALRPGLLLIRSEGVLDYLPPALRKWSYIVPPEPDIADFPQYEDDDLVIASPYIDLNVLSIDESTVCVNEAAKGLIKTLEAHRFTVVPIRHRHRRLFGGGLHCFTLDTVRAGGVESYLE
jgi:glycine amidinotransferase